MSTAVRVAQLGDLAGAYDPDTDVIWLDSGLTRVEARCTLAHEMVHAGRGDEPGPTGWHTRHQEATVEQAAARTLITLDALADAARWATNIQELADELDVDEAMLRCRLEHLHPSERARLRYALANREENP